MNEMLSPFFFIDISSKCRGCSALVFFRFLIKIRRENVQCYLSIDVVERARILLNIAINIRLRGRKTLRSFFFFKSLKIVITLFDDFRPLILKNCLVLPSLFLYVFFYYHQTRYSTCLKNVFHKNSSSSFSSLFA